MVQSLHSHCPVTGRCLYTPANATVQSLRRHCAVPSQLLHTDCALTVHNCRWHTDCMCPVKPHGTGRCLRLRRASSARSARHAHSPTAAPPSSAAATSRCSGILLPEIVTEISWLWLRRACTSQDPSRSAPHPSRTDDVRWREASVLDDSANTDRPSSAPP